MDINEALKLGRKLLDENGLKDWKIDTNFHKRSHGICYHSKKKIEISEILTPHCKDSAVLNTLTHEIAHALVGPKQGHGDLWRNTHIRLGGNGERLSNEDSYEDGKDGQIKVKEQHSNYVAVCKNGHVVYSNKLSRRNYSCSQCCDRFNPEFLMIFKRNPKKIR